MVPLGFRIWIGLVALRLLLTGKSLVAKFAVAPVSAMMLCCNSVGGPVDRISDVVEQRVSAISFILPNGFPPFQRPAPSAITAGITATRGGGDVRHHDHG